MEHPAFIWYLPRDEDFQVEPVEQVVFMCWKEPSHDWHPIVRGQKYEQLITSHKAAAGPRPVTSICMASPESVEELGWLPAKPPSGSPHRMTDSRTPSCSEYHPCGRCWSSLMKMRIRLQECWKHLKTQLLDGGNWNANNWNTWEGRLGVVILTCLWILFEELQQDCCYNFSYSDYEASSDIMVMAVPKYVSVFVRCGRRGDFCGTFSDLSPGKRFFL